MITSLPTDNLFGITVKASMPKGISISLTGSGAPALLAIIGLDGRIIAQGPSVATEVFGVVLKAYDDFMCANGTIKNIHKTH